MLTIYGTAVSGSSSVSDVGIHIDALVMRTHVQRTVSRCFSIRLKLSLPTPGSLKLYGGEFLSDGPVTEKARGPTALSRHCGTTSKRRVTDRRCCCAETSHVEVCRVPRCLAVQTTVHYDAEFVLNSFRHIESEGKVKVREAKGTG